MKRYNDTRFMRKGRSERTASLRSLPFLLLLILSSALGAVPAVAQAPQPERADVWSGPVETSPRMAAFRRNGMVPDIGKKGEVIGGVLYVKLRPGYEGASAAATAAGIAARAGLQAQAASTLAALDVPLALSVRQGRAMMSAQRLERALAAEAELGRIIEVSYLNTMHPRRAAALLERMPEVEYAEPIGVPQLLSPSEPNDPRIADQKQLAAVNAIEAWKIWAGDTSVIIGVVDAGINMFHEDLYPNIAPNYGESGTDGSGNDRADNGIDDDGNGVIDDWKGANLTAAFDGTEHGNTVGSEHGTQVAGYAAAATDNGIGIAGIGNRCRFFPVKTAANGGGGLIEAYNGVLYCARQGFRVINCSWGDNGYSRAEQDIITNVTLAYDAAVVAGAGNDFEYGVFYPAGYRHVLGVGGINEQGQYIKTWGEQVDISTGAGLTTSGTALYYDLEPATSYTTPVVSGIVALVRSRWPELSARQALAHVRLSSNGIDALNLDKAKLVGYGKADALKAVSTDPFSHPGFLIDSVWTTDEEGNPKETFALGERGLLRFGMTNVLGDAGPATARIARYTEDSAAIRFDGEVLEIGGLGGGASWVTPQGIPFEIVSPSQGLTRIRIDFEAENYSDYAYEFLRIYRPYTVYETPRLSLTLTESGRLGFDYRSFGQVGEGVVFDDRPALYEGGVIVVQNRDRVLDNVRSEDSDVQNEDFTVVEPPMPGNDSTLTLSDANAPAGRRIGLELRMRVRTTDTVRNAVGIEVRVRNTGDGTIDSLRVGLFCDWDLDGASAGQRVSFVEGPTGGIAFHGLVENPGGSHVASGVAAPAEFPAFYAITNNADPLSIQDGFDKGEKWRTLSNGIGNGNSGPGDISLVTGSVLTDLDPGREDTVLFVFGFSLENSEEATAGMRRFVGQPLTGVAEEEAKDKSGYADAIRIRPNPAAYTAVVAVPGGLPRGGRLRLYSADGRVILDLTSLQARGADRGEFEMDLSEIPSGLYYLRLEQEETSVARPVLVVK